MDPYGNFESVPYSCAHDKKAEHAGSETASDETYCADQLNVSGNSCDCAGYFEMPDCVMDVYLQALDGGDESNAALRNISNVYGPKEDDKEVDTNCNHNVNPEPLPNEGCGCTGSYNGGAGAGTASCSYDPCGPYEQGFQDKKRDAICMCCQDDTYQTGLVNKKPSYTDEYKQLPLYIGSPQSSGSCCRPQNTSCSFDDTYQQPLVNKKPESLDKYVPVIPSPDPYNDANDSSALYALQRFNSRSPDRSNFYDDSCGCHRQD